MSPPPLRAGWHYTDFQRAFYFPAIALASGDRLRPSRQDPAARPEPRPSKTGTTKVDLPAVSTRGLAPSLRSAGPPSGNSVLGARWGRMGLQARRNPVSSGLEVSEGPTSANPPTIRSGKGPGTR